jgi:hypothetical protein
MKHLFFFTTLSLLLLASCTKDSTCTVKLNQPFTMAYNQTACSETEQFAIKFDSVVTDCRCPANATCIWAGYAAIKLSYVRNNKQAAFYLSTLYSKTDTVIDGYKFHLNQVNPYPADFSSPPAQESYNAEIVVTK